MRLRRQKRSRERMPTHYSVLDLGTSAVKALVVELNGAGVSILGRGRAPHGSGMGGGGTVGNLDALAAACEYALIQAEDATEASAGRKIVPDASLIAVPAAWVRGAMGTGSVWRTHLEQGITAAECAEAAVRAGRHSLRYLGREPGAGEWMLLDAVLASFRVDGRYVTDPLGFRGQALEATAFTVMAPGRLLDALRGVADALRLDSFKLVAEPLVLSAALPDSGLLIDMGAHVTNLILARYGAPVRFAALPMGGTALEKALASAWEFTPGRAREALRAYGAGRLPEEQHVAVREVLEEPLRVWMAGVIECLRSWGGVGQPCAPEVYVCGGASALEDVQHLVAAMSWPDVLPFACAPRVRLWDGSNLAQVEDRTEQRWRLDGVTCLALAAWTQRNRGPETPEGALCVSLGLKG